MRRRLRATLLAGALSGGVVSAAGEDLPRVSLRIEPRQGRVGDRLSATLEVVVPEGTRVEHPVLGPGQGPFTWFETSWEGPEPEGSGSRWVWKGAVAAYETGELEVPSIAVRLSGPGGESVERTEPVAVRIDTVLPPDEADPDLAATKPPVSIPPDFGNLRTALLVLAGLVAVSLVLWWLHRRYADRLTRVPAPDDPFHRMAPHVWVYAELQRLIERRLPEQGEVKPFFVELSRIVKQYLGGRYRIDLLERTTTELVAELKAAEVPPSALAAARELLDLGDRVKFAGQAADVRVCARCVEQAYRIVDTTRTSGDDARTKRGAA